MKKDLGVKPYLFPMPVLIIGTYSEDGTPDAMNAAYGTLCDFRHIALYLSAGHKTIADERHLIQCDYVGLVSANTDKEKIGKSGFTLTKSKNVDAPVIEDLPLTLECKLDYIDEKSGAVYGEIVNIIAEEGILTDGNVDLNKPNPISYDPASRCYFRMGGKVGTAFHDGAALKK